MDEKKVGEVFLCGIKTLRCIISKDHTCNGCTFDTGVNCNRSKNEVYSTGPCISLERKDGVDVIFVED